MAGSGESAKRAWLTRRAALKTKPAAKEKPPVKTEKPRVKKTKPRVKVEKPVTVRSYNVGSSDYAKHNIQPWDIWDDYKLDPWDADIVKRILRTKKGESATLDYEKIKHICDKQIERIKKGIKN